MSPRAAIKITCEDAQIQHAGVPSRANLQQRTRLQQSRTIREHARPLCRYSLYAEGGATRRPRCPRQQAPAARRRITGVSLLSRVRCGAPAPAPGRRFQRHPPACHGRRPPAPARDAPTGRTARTRRRRGRDAAVGAAAAAAAAAARRVKGAPPAAKAPRRPRPHSRLLLAAVESDATVDSGHVFPLLRQRPTPLSIVRKTSWSPTLPSGRWPPLRPHFCTKA